MSITIARPQRVDHPRRGHRALAGAVSTVVAAAGLTIVAAPAHAEPTAGALEWKISQRFVDHLSSRTLADGAAFDADAKSFSFPKVASTFDAARGISTTTFDGSVRGAFAFNGNEFYHVTVEDPIVTVDAKGEGTVSAVVSSANASSGPTTPAASTDPKRVTVTTFDATSGTWNSSLTATPRWSGVIPTGSAVESLGIPADQPVDSKAFAPTFLGNLTSGVRAHFFASGATSDASKAPATFVAPIERPARTASVSVAPASGTYGTSTVARATVTYAAGTPADGSVTFSGPVARTVALSNGVAEVSLPAGLPTGTSAITATYSGDFFTPSVAATGTVSVAKAAVKVKRNKIKRAPTSTSTGKTTITVRSNRGAAVDGKAVVTFSKKGRKSKSKKVTIKNGKANVTIPKLSKGTWKITVKYSGTDSFDKTGSRKIGSVKVKK